MKKKGMFLAALAAALTLTASVGSAWAYFTTYAEARGSYTISLKGHETTVSENFSAWTKEVTVANDADSDPVYVRARAFCGSEYRLSYSDEGGRWSPAEDGYYYYDSILPGGASTEKLLVKIEGIPEDAEDGDNFNVVVVYETAPVRYDESGEPYADWSAILDTGTVKGGA